MGHMDGQPGRSRKAPSSQAIRFWPRTTVASSCPRSAGSWAGSAWRG